MSKLKKILLMCTAYALVAALAIGGTIAYLTSEDSDVNVMTMGNVKIELNEYQWNEDGTSLEEFEQGKPLYPYVGTLGWKNTTYADGAYRQFTMNNSVDKYVTVKNIGTSDAYVRTVIALEMGDLTIAEMDTYIGVAINSYNGSEFSYAGAWKWDGLDSSNIIVDEDGNKYVVLTATHLAPLAPGEETIPSLLQVYMTNTATNEIVEKVDGNNNGTYDILVLAQAIQSAGFEDAGLAYDSIMTLAGETPTKFSAEIALDSGYGEPIVKAPEWFSGMEIPKYVSTTAAFDDALANGGTIVLNDNVVFGGKLTKSANVNLAGNNIEADGVTVNADLSLADGTYTMDHYSDYMDLRPVADTTYTYKNMTFINNYKTKPSSIGTDYIEYVAKLVPTEAGIKTTIVFENCKFVNARFESNGLSGKNSEIDITFKNCTFDLLGHENAIYIGNYFSGVVNIENCTFNYQGVSGNKAALSVSNSSNTTVTVNATNNKLHAVAATPYTYDPEKGETQVDTIKLDYYGAKNYCFFDYRYLSGGYSTVNESGTVISGEIATESRR